MTSIIIRDLDDALQRRLCVRAAARNRSVEEEAEDILRCALAMEHEESDNLADRIRRRIAPLGGVELELPPRGPMRDSPDFA